MTEAEFAEIVGSTKRTVLAAVSRTLPAEYYHAIDDIVQETYIRAYRSLVSGKFRNEAALTTWLYTIARNETLRMLKKLKREEEKYRREQERRQKREMHEAETATRPDILPYIDRLPEKQRAVMMLFLEGKREKEIASKLGIAIGTVKSRLFRGKECIRNMIRDE
ncbi:MAG: RNA polymerase sigma factor [Spirochaetota bacterium]